VVLGAAALAMERRLTYTALIAYLAYSVPHLVFHATHLEPFTPADAAAQTSVLALGVVLPILLLTLLRRVRSTPRSE
jgi:hypothetical protein